MGEATVNLDVFNELIDNDQELREELLEVFYESLDECMAGLDKACIPKGLGLWHEGMHAIKGAAINIGAYELAKLADDFQNKSDSTQSQRQGMLDMVEEEYQKVKQYLQSL